LGDNGRELTSLIGELSVCDLLGLEWSPSAGYDAKGGGDTYQIKTRKSWTTEGVNRAGRLGRFGTKQGYDFTVGIYVELDNNFIVTKFWKFKKSKIEELERNGQGRGLHVSTVVNHNDPDYPVTNGS
jgi:hypothetical protein